MKRISFYIILLFQIILLLFFMFQLEREHESEEIIKIRTSVPEYYNEDDYYFEVVEQTMYVDYEISKISEDKWNNREEPDYNNRVYVLLEENEAGIFDVVAGADYPLNPTNEQIMLSAFYGYHDKQYNFHSVRYGFEEIKNADEYGSFRRNEELIVTVKIGKWGQREIMHVEKME